MQKYELSKDDFELLDEAFKALATAKFNNMGVISPKLETLREKFANAHTGWLEMEDE